MRKTYYVSSLGPNASYLQTLKDELTKTLQPLHLVFVPSSEIEYPYRKDFERDFVNQLKTMNIMMDSVISLNPDSSCSEFKAALQQANFIYLHGGNPLVFQQFLKSKDCYDFFDKYQYTVMGLSAGAMLLSENIVLTPTNQEYPDFVIQKAFGYQNVNIYPHMNYDKVVFSTMMTGDGLVKIDDLMALSDQVSIQLLKDGHFIVDQQFIGEDFYQINNHQLYRYHQGTYQPIEYDRQYLDFVVPNDVIVMERIFMTMEEAMTQGFLKSLCHADSTTVIQPLQLSLLKLEECGQLYQQSNFNDLKTWVFNHPQLRFGTLVLQQVENKVLETFTFRTRYLKVIEAKNIIPFLRHL